MKGSFEWQQEKEEMSRDNIRKKKGKKKDRMEMKTGKAFDENSNSKE